MCKAYYTIPLRISQGEISQAASSGGQEHILHFRQHTRRKTNRKTAQEQDDYCNPASFPVQ
jgi:hypothetical protein